ncbi:type VII secretion integral membrane protein EccD [Gordonia sp. TBRC 11910]|uniref:Type VII secretion integral membrane protein EccD n=1 Tax=Gordonia asplenii TaxID=2725283 RepID=A0A848KQI1_9ACTN|nr:type VII secretion integral membrane protein EccD [Gordonia asplenii]NMO00492.1 type VII secretion integral membrane protein EccD [Gordonia asplenii]
MAANFVRLTILADDNQLDISLPAHRPVVEYIDDVVSMFGPSAASPTTAWALSSSAHGPIELDDSLADHSVSDGATLFLTKAPDAAPPPFIDDVIAEMQRSVDGGYERWTPDTRRRWLSATLAAVMLIGSGFVYLRPGDDAVVAGALAVLAAVCMAVGIAGRRGALGYLIWAGAPIVGAAVWRITHTSAVAAPLCWSLAAAGAVVAFAGYATARSRPVMVAAGIVSALFLIAGAAFAAGANPTAFTVWASIGLVVGCIVTPRIALTSSGLLAQIRRSEQMELADRAAVDAGLRRGRDVVDGLVWAESVLVVPVVATIAVTGVWEQALVAIVLVLIFALRSRSFTHVRHVAPMLGAAGVSALILGCAVPQWFSMTGTSVIGAGVVATLVVGAVVLAGQLPGLDDVPAARLRRFLDGIDLPLALAYFPVVFVGQGIYGFFWPN